MTIEELEQMWEKDSEIDSVRLDSASLDTPKLQNKYLKLSNGVKLLILQLEGKYNDLAHLKGLYYSGKMSKEELEMNGWEPYHIRVLKNDLRSYYEADADLKKIRLKIDYNKIMELYLKEIIEQLNKRTWMVSNAIKFRQFTSGES